MLYQEWKFFYIENIYRNKFSKFKFILSEILNWIKRKKIGILIKYERLAAVYYVLSAQRKRYLKSIIEDKKVNFILYC